ncbi:MAG: tetratricopeptide repeat protein [bacterium]
MSSEAMKREAVRAFRVAFRHQRAGDVKRAVYHYRRSLELLPTAEAYTFLGWAYSFQGRLEEAIEQCRKAIEIDPSFSNPYNDIGAYLIEQERLEEALSWLDRALEAPRCQSHCHPHYHRGRALHRLGRIAEAAESFRKALEQQPGFRPALLALRHLAGGPEDQVRSGG